MSSVPVREEIVTGPSETKA